MRNILLLVLPLAFASPTLAARADTRARGEQALAKALQGATPGKPVHCLWSRDRQDSQTIDGVGILYRHGSTYWLNRFQNGCPNLHFDTIVVTRTTSDQLCRGEIAQIVDSTSNAAYGSCVFGDFESYTK